MRTAGYRKSGVNGKVRVTVCGKGANRTPPALPLALPARVQLQAQNGQCWEARFDELGASKNDARLFEGRPGCPKLTGRVS